MQLLLDPNRKRALASLYTDAELQFSPPVFGEVIPLTIGKVSPNINSPNRLWNPDSLMGWQIQAGIGKVFLTPVAGTFILTYEAEETLPLSYDASASDVETALNSLSAIIADGGVTVSEQSANYYIVTFDEPGAQSLIGSDLTNLAPVSVAEHGRIITGTGGGLREIQQIRILQRCAALSNLETESDPADVTVDVLTVGGGGNNAKIRFSLTPTPYDGRWTITISGNESSLIAWDASEDDLEAILEAVSGVGSGNVEVAHEDTGVYLVAFKGALANTDVGVVTADGSALKVIDFRSGYLDLRQAALELIFGTAAFADCIFEIKGSPPAGAPQTLLYQSMRINAPVIAPDSFVNFPADALTIFELDIPSGAESVTYIYPIPFANNPIPTVTLGIPTGGTVIDVVVVHDASDMTQLVVNLGFPTPDANYKLFVCLGF